MNRLLRWDELMEEAKADIAEKVERLKNNAID
jgi:hypothetical protein